ncbi:peptide ABC transporter substrate-binding protein [Nakamurella deserti]|uniref:peptide ABC transporter substrate-binding protein n=1 Tax=Nakamurella deserti TaxID=2164074 RepID=UPI00197B2B8C|nr:ABC transporter substrate-binding protein [Nakamurella deserti]
MGHTPRSVLLRTVAVIVGTSLVLTACGSSNDNSNTTTSTSSSDSAAGSGGAGSGGATTGIVTALGSEPQNPLVPTNTNEVGGGKVLTSIFAGLVYYDAEGAPQNEVAESITSDDSQTWTITLEPGWTFTNGEPVTANSFVDAWNYGALGTNAQLSSYFFDPIEGFAEVNAETPTAQTLSGLTVVSDTEFTVKLVSPQSDFPLRLGYSAYMPLPKAAFADMAAFGENPIGNGPYKLQAWDHGNSISLVPNETYTGDRVPQNGGLNLVFYATNDAAYADVLSGNLDVIDQLPPSALTTFESDLGDRAVNQPAAIFQSFTIPQNLPHFGGDEGKLRREAISMAINRDEITSVIFNNTRTPAKDFTSPVIAGYSDSVPGNEVLTYDADAAKAKWAEADAIAPWSGSFTIAYNSDGPHKEWVDAVSNSLKNTLGIDASGVPFPSFADIRTQITDRTITGAFRSGWQADYPSMSNFLGPLYYTGAGSNDGDYSSAEFDKLIDQAAAAPDTEAGTALYQQAQTVLFNDLPAIPLWYQNVDGGSADTVGNVTFGWDSVPLYYAITKE